MQIKNKVGAFLGKISYSLYLIHILCAPVFEMAFIKLIPTVGTGGKIGVQILCVLSSLIAAYIFQLTVEQYFINMANRLFGTKKNVVNGTVNTSSKLS